MTGLKLLAEKVDAQLMSRAVTGHAASVGIAGALSFAFARGIASSLGAAGAYTVATLCADSALAIVLFLIPGTHKSEVPNSSVHPVATERRGALLDFRPVFSKLRRYGVRIGVLHLHLENERTTWLGRRVSYPGSP
jgi:hypothetical protein